ncbi:MAG TPA: DUF3488 and transglutaminase-like domain-containing protein [Phycisphaerales bacterium]|nr:DUF3488 and transglutaminase-like domain-containing protein [Phycisphaerales bacterium]
MLLAERFNSVLHLCVAIAGLAFAAADDRPLLAVILSIAVGVCWLVARRRVDHPPALPRAAINALVLVAILNAALKTGAGPTGDSVVSTLGQFLVFITLIKLLDRRAARDDAQVITLAIFVAIAAMLTSADLLVGLLLIVFVPVSVGTAMLWQLRAGQIMLTRAVAEGTGATDAGEGRRVLPVSGRRPRRAFLGVCAAAVSISCAIATGVFVVIPRVGGEFLGRFGVTRQTMIGFRESVTLGQAGLLSEDPTPVLDLLVTDAKGENLGSSSVTQYLRGAARDQYVASERAWKDSSQKAPGQLGPQGRQHSVESIGAGSAWGLRWPDPPDERTPERVRERRIVQKITMRSDANNLFFVWRPETITPDRDVKLSFRPETGTIRREEPWGPRFTYTVRSVTAEEAYPLAAAPGGRDAALGFQEGPVKELAERIAGPGRSGRQVATVIRDYLQKGFAYTTEMVAPPEGRDAIEFFLFDRKRGHCEYFASAMAAMCQSQGIPARVVTGYVAAEFNALTGQYTVRQSNAHAWVEAFIVADSETGRGRWERFDPSPPAEIDRIHHPVRGLLSSARAWYETLEFGWSSSFVAFDNLSSKRRGGGMFSETDVTPQLVVWGDRWVAWVKTMVADPSRMPWWLRWSPGLAVGAIAFMLLGGLLWRRWRPRPRSPLARQYGYVPERPSGVYARALRALDRAGIPKPEVVPPARFAVSLAGSAPRTSGALARLARYHYDARFGGREPSTSDAAAAQGSLRELDRALREERPGR